MSAATTSQAMFRVLGENDDASECLCCGRQGLRKVVWLQPLDQDGNDFGEPVHFGRVCGAKAAGWGYGSDAALLARFKRARVVVSYYDHPLIREIYGAWTLVECPVTKAMVNQGMRDQEGVTKAPEILLINGESRTTGGLFA